MKGDKTKQLTINEQFNLFHRYARKGTSFVSVGLHVG